MSESHAHRFLLVDDHALLRRGLRELLLGEFQDAEFGEAATGPEAIDLVRSSCWNLVVLDISMPGRDGLDILKDIGAQAPPVPVLVLSVHGEEQYAIRALRAGAMGYVTKDSAPEELVGAVRKALLGRRYVTVALAEALATSLATDPARPLHEGLSDREMQVLRMLATGKAVKEIGAQLALSEKTVSTYRTRLLGKLNMKTNAELTRYALRVGLIE